MSSKTDTHHKKDQLARVGLLFFHIFGKSFDRLKRFVRDIVLDAAGILGGDVLAYSEGNEERRDKRVPFVYLFCDALAAFGEREVTVFADGDESSLAQNSERTADGRL